MAFIAASLFVSNSADSTAPRPSLSQLEALVATSVAIKATPNLANTLPPLLKMTSKDASISPSRSKCYPASASSNVTIPIDAGAQCAYGDTASSHILLLTGDSQAGMWLPAFDQMGRTLGWRIVFLAHPECPPWGVPNKPNWVIQGGFTVAQCTSFDHNVVAWAAKNSPNAVVLAGRAHPIGSIATKPLVLSILQPRVSSAIQAFHAITSRVITMAPLPAYTPDWTKYTPSTCLAYIKPITKCEGSPTQMVSPVLLAAITNASKAAGTLVLSPTPLLCTSQKCALFIKDSAGIHLVYYDELHINRYFSAWIADALTTLISPDLQGG
jgi:hypothetical protein